MRRYYVAAPKKLLRGTDVFTYTVEALDADGNADTASTETNLVSVTILNVNHPPVGPLLIIIPAER